jgi:glycosyltransferase involved in cell wall biosynthesis
MRIALLHYAAPPVVGGVESVLAHQARLLAGGGHQATVIAGRGEQTDPRVPFVPLPLADSRHPDVLVIKAALDQGQVPPGYEPLVQALISALQPALAGVHVLIAHNVCSLNKNLALTDALHRLNGRRGFPRLILWHHDLAWTTPRYRPELHPGPPWDLLRTAWPDAFQVVVSALRQQELAELMRLPLDHIRVVPNGVDLAAFFKLEAQTQDLLARLPILEAAPLLLLPVRITPRKNIELALRALAGLRRRLPQAALVVTGPLGPHNPANVAYFEALSALRAELGLGGAAFFLAEAVDGYLPDAVVADFYRLADALFMPSREEGFGIPLIEAAFSRLPIFCADIPPLRELGGDDAHYFSPDADPGALAERLAAELQSLATIRFAGRARRAFTWEQVYALHLAPLLAQARP